MNEFSQRQRVPAGIRRGLVLVFLAFFFSAQPAATAPKTIALTAEGQQIAALFWTPAQKSARVPAVILLHMLHRSKEDWRSFGDFLERNGYAALALDLRGGGNLGKEKLVADARAAFAFLTAQPGIDAQRIAIIGASIGANGALWFAVEEPRVKCAVMLSPGLNYRGVETPAAMTQMKRPVLLVASENDGYSATTVRRLELLARGPKALKIYNDAGHGTQIFGASVGLENEILSFFKSHL